MSVPLRFAVAAVAMSCAGAGLARPDGRGADPYVDALRETWVAAASGSVASFGRHVAAGATLRIDRADGAFTRKRLGQYASKCRFVNPAFHHPWPGDEHYGKPFTSWASADLACVGMAASRYRLTAWFDEAGRISSADLLTPVSVPG